MSNDTKWTAQKKLNILLVLNIVKDNPKIKTYQLVSKLVVNEPFISRAKAKSLIEDLFYDEKIKIDDFDEVTLCR